MFSFDKNQTKKRTRKRKMTMTTMKQMTMRKKEMDTLLALV
jgi:hypothetical protein